MPNQQITVFHHFGETKEVKFVGSPKYGVVNMLIILSRY